MQPHRGTLILVLGILSIVISCLPIGPFAWIMGKNDLKKIADGQMDPEGQGTTKAGMICGIIGTVFFILAILYFIFVFVVVGMTAATGMQQMEMEMQMSDPPAIEESIEVTQ